MYILANMVEEKKGFIHYKIKTMACTLLLLMAYLKYRTACCIQKMDWQYGTVMK